MKLILSSFLFFFICFSVFPQQSKEFTKLDVDGTIIEKSNNQPLEFATIIFKPEKGDNVFGGLTNEKGKFKIEVAEGTYNISIEFLSFKTITYKNITINQDKNLGTIYIEEDAQTLDEVELIAEKSTVEIRLDKKIYNVGKDMTVKGGTASDVLDNVPSVTVDADGVVSLRGNENVRILINGKPSGLVGLNDTQALQQFPAEAIKSVEVITSPSARYDAEGTAGIINIILRQEETLGFNGSATLSAGYPDYYGFSTNLNYRLEKVNFFTNIGYSDRTSPGNSNFYTEYFSPDVANPFLKENIDYIRKGNDLNTNFGLEYFLTEKSSITGSFLYRISDDENTSDNNTNAFDENMVLNYSKIRKEDQEEKDEVIQYSLNYTHNYTKNGHKLTFDFQFEENTEDEFSFITNQQTFPISFNELSEKINSDDDQQRLLFQGDYVLPIEKNQQFEAGFRSTINDQSTDYEFYNEDLNGDFILNENVSNIFIYDENIHAFYSQYGNKYGKFSVLFGLRLESTNIAVKIEGEDLDFKKEYTNLFPTLNLAYEITENENITFGYNRRISRPRSRFINPFPSQSSQTNIFQGNPDLDPSISNGIDLGYYKNWNVINFNTSIYYNHAINVFQFITEDTGEETSEGFPIIRRTPINLATNDRYGYEFSLNYTPIKQWRFSTSFNFYNSTIIGEYDGVDYGSENISWFARFSSKIVLPAEIDWQTTMMYRGPYENSQSKSEGMFMANMAFSKDILKNNATISFNIDDLFNTRKRQTETFTETFHSNSEFQRRERSFKLSFSYRFKQKKKRERSGEMNAGDDGGFDG